MAQQRLGDVAQWGIGANAFQRLGDVAQQGCVAKAPWGYGETVVGIWRNSVLASWGYGATD